MARILACGAFLKNAACLLDTSHPHAAQWSEVHGDLSDPAACVALERSVRNLLEYSVRTLKARSDAPVDAVAHDLHPDFFSTHLAQRLAAALGVPAFAVQHHHAHIAAIMAEHRLERPVIGIALDGVGLGTDGTAWGGEVLWVDGVHFERVGHLLPLALPGGDVAAREPWRMAAAALHACGLTAQIEPRFCSVVGAQAARTLRAMLQRGLNCPWTSAAGRWFDAAAGLLGLSVRQEFEAQAAIALEQAAARHLQHHPLIVNPAHWELNAQGRIGLRPLFMSWSTLDLHQSAQVDEAAARFHLTLADALTRLTGQVAQSRGVRDVALGGGCFFNRVLTSRIKEGLEVAGLTVWTAQAHSCGDAGLALGQAWVAARQLAALPTTPLTHQEEPLCA